MDTEQRDLDTRRQFESRRKRKSCLIAALFIAGFLGMLIFVFCKTLVPVNYIRFSADRIRELEQEYNMTLTDVDLKRYWVPSIAQDIYDRFNFSVSDYSDFMSQCYHGEIVKFAETDDKSSAEYKCKPYNDRFTFLIRFQQNGDRYDAELTSYYE